ncbi:hypothetical protein [Methylobacterium sp. A54F]
MSFTVSARASLRRLTYQHGSLLSALDQGMTLSAAGMADVRITDRAGRAFTPAALYQTLFAAEASIPRAPRALAA